LTPPPDTRHALPATAAAFLVTVLGYVLLGRLALWLAIPPSYASPLYPAAGLALAMVLVHGRRMAPAVVLGAFIINFWSSPPPAGNALAWLVPAAIAGGAALQALAGAALVRRFVRQPLTLAEPRDILRFYAAGAFVACVLNASLGTATLAAAGIVPRSALPMTWLTWWVGDTLGTLIAAPIVLTLTGRPRADWAPRRATVGLTLGFVTLLLAVTILQVIRWEEQRARNNFDRDADNAVSTLNYKLQESLHAVQALHGVFASSDRVDRAEMAAATAPWLKAGSALRALGYAQRVARSDLAAFEAAAQADGHGGYQVADRPADEASPKRRLPLAGDEAWAIRQIEPPAGNEGALGVNLLSVNEARAALASAIDSGDVSVTAAFRLSQERGLEPEVGVVVYRSLYRGPLRESSRGAAAQPSAAPATVTERRARAEGAVFATLEVAPLLRQVATELPPYLRLCLFDGSDGARPVLLAGGMRCETTPPGFVHRHVLTYAGRPWVVQVDAAVAELPGAGQSNAWLFSIVGLLATAVLGALLLTVTGRARRIEVAVNERTAALRQQVQEREQAEAAMRESEQRFRNIFNNVPLGLVYTDLDGNVKQTNPHFCELVGYEAEALIGMNARDFTHPDDVGREREAIRRLVAGELSTDRRQKRYFTRAGVVVWVQSTLSVLRDERGMPQRIVSAAEDITENLRLADADRARRAAEASNRAKSEFLSRMSHELRTPLNAMLGFAQLLDLDRRHPLADAQRPWVEQIQQAGWHLLEMINDVLDLSRIESGNLRLAVETLDLADLLAATVPLLERAEQRRQIQHRPRPRARGQRGSRRAGRDHRHRHRHGHDAGAAGRPLPAIQPPGARAHRTRGHRHRPGHQPAPGRTDGRQLEGAQRGG